MRKTREPAERIEGPTAASGPSLEDELEEAAELLSHQEPPVPESRVSLADDTDPLLIDPAD